ncbi:hypothetical protein EDD85DRAFT_955325 [Armillaria nabsnona]|nr:hypothetical protein EDD85DRAFT_955325 [Armillaria nabsnona]
MPDNKFGLFMKQANLLVSQSYLAGSCFVDTADWCSVGGTDILCSKSDVTLNTESILVSLVTVPFSAGWYNKLSGMGDFDERYPKVLPKLKWLLHVKPPIGTIFMEDWNQVISVLGCLQKHVSVGQPMDMLLSRTSGMEIRFTAKMFKEKNVMESKDTITQRYVIPLSFREPFGECTARHCINPINIKDHRGCTILMGAGTEKAVGGSLCLLTFEACQLLLDSPVLLMKYIVNKQIKHYHIDNRDSFNASLKSIKILVLVGSLPGVIADMNLSFSVELKAANIFGPTMQDEPSTSDDRPVATQAGKNKARASGSNLGIGAIPLTTGLLAIWGKFAVISKKRKVEAEDASPREEKRKKSNIIVDEHLKKGQ